MITMEFNVVTVAIIVVAIMRRGLSVHKRIGNERLYGSMVRVSLPPVLLMDIFCTIDMFMYKSYQLGNPQ